ncbi:hypothetical protein SLS56_006582 [Neofusicoccum ribis]|uniref:BTB domain-containing protein n=1 Tax=Neofusicoccum ribis TaxID=45134 RepID=A0ABR3SQH2_9PEZI
MLGNPLIVHRELICAASPFFKAAFEGDQNNQDGIVTLHQDQYDRDAVETYLKWLYTNQILSPSGDDEFRYLIDAYLTGDKFGDTAFKNAVLDEIIERCSQQNEYPTDIAEYIWSNTAEGSPLRRLYIDFYAWVSDSDFYAMDDGGSDVLVAPREFLRDVLCRMSEVRNRCRFPGAYIYPWVMNRCQYHEHGGGDCCRSSDWGSPSTLTNLYWTLNDEK